MLLIDDAKAPPPTPLNKAQMRRKTKGQLGFFKPAAVITIGIIRRMLVLYTTFRPPHTCVRKELGILRVPPERPAIAGNVYRSALYFLPVGAPQSWNGYRPGSWSCICWIFATITDHESQTPNAQSRLGMLMSKFLVAIFDPPV